MIKLVSVRMGTPLSHYLKFRIVTLACLGLTRTGHDSGNFNLTGCLYIW